MAHRLIDAMKAKALSLGHAFDEKDYDDHLEEAEAFFCIYCNELYVYFLEDDELIGGRGISDPDNYGHESIVNAKCPVKPQLAN